MNDLVSRFNAYPLGQKVLMMLLLIILMVVGFYMLHYQAYVDEVTSLNAQIDADQRKRQNLEMQKRDRVEVLSRLEQLKRDLLLAREQLPADAEVGRLLEHVHNQAKTAGLEIVRFKRVEDSPQNYYTEIPVEMKLNGSFDELANFFFYLGRMTRIVNVRDIRMKQASATKLDDPEGAGELEVDALATTFMYIPPAAPAAPAGAATTPPAR